MKIIVEAESQEEFDAKRSELARVLAKARVPGVYRTEKPALTPRRAALPAQNEIFDHWNTRYLAMIEAIKGEVDAVFRDAAG